MIVSRSTRHTIDVGVVCGSGWYTFDTMGQLLDALTTWPHPLIGQMEAVNEFFNNPQWLPIDLEPFPLMAIARRI